MVLYFIRLKRNFKKAINRLLLSLYSLDRNINIGGKTICEKVPQINITDNGKLSIGNRVTLRRDIEIRVHKNASVIIEDGCRIDRGVRILATNNAKLKISKGVRIGLHSVLNGGDDIYIGEDSLISGFVYLQTSMHNYKGNEHIKDQGYTHQAIHLSKNVWCGAHAVILPGVSLGEGCIVGSNAVVNSSYKDNMIVGGVPARLIKEK